MFLVLKPQSMNFLAHLYLSGDNQPLKIGNFIGDFVKGRAFEKFDSEIRKGILLHREIDQYTDDHGIVLKSKERLRPKYHHYSPVIIDIFYDHFLSSLWDNYHDQPLLEYTMDFYNLMRDFESIIPENARKMIFFMEKGNWLYNYQYIEGIHKALTGMSNRSNFDSKMEHASNDLQQDYIAYKKEFEVFFPELITHTKKVLASL